MSSPADMPKKRPVHPYRPPGNKKPVPEWRCWKKGYRTQEAADEALGEIWSKPFRGDNDPMEAHTYRCRRHKREVWHLTSQDPERRQEGRAS